MNFAQLFKSVKNDIHDLNTLPSVLKRAKRQKSFKIMLNSIQNALRDQITEQLGVSLEQVDHAYLNNFDSKVRILGHNLEIIFRRLSISKPQKLISS